MADKKEFNWRKISWLIILVLVVGYGFGEPYLEKWLGIDLPSIRDNQDVATVENDRRDIHGDNRNNGHPTNPKISSQAKNSYLTPTGRKSRLKSPAGLVYGMGGGGEHRFDHVMRHAQDDKSRPVHSVFSGSEEDILRVIDEAYDLIQSNSNRVRSRKDKDLHFRVEHVVDMQRKIGYLGGQRGNRENHPPRSKLTLILDNGKFVITAYPDR